MPKKDIHPKWYPDAKVICNGEVVMTVGATQPELNVELWSGNHPFYTGQMRIVDTEGQVERFYKRLQAREDYIEAQQTREQRRVSPDRPIAELELSKRAIDKLAQAGLVNVGQFLAKLEQGDEAVLAIDGFGRKSLADVKKRLRTLGYELPDPEAV